MRLKDHIPAKILFSSIKGDFDIWRKHYDALSINDLIWINNGLHPFVGLQKHYNLKAIKTALDEILIKKQKLSVIELGCGSGFLAHDLLKAYNENQISLYTGYDINYYAIDETIFDDDRYRTVKMTDWFYDCLFTGDILISCHTLEHFNKEQVYTILTAVRCTAIKYCIFEIPFSNNITWEGQHNSHILEMASEEFLDIAKYWRFEPFAIIDTTRQSRKHLYSQLVFGLRKNT